MEYIPAKTIVYHDKSKDWFAGDYKMNIYKGCDHGCIYCDSRSDCYQVENFDTIRAKQNALTIIRDDLRRKIKPGVVVTGAASDPYNRFEEELCLSRHALELINAYGFGAGIATKSPLVARDGDILADITSHSPVIIKMTITCADDELCRKIEPHVAPSSQRFAALRTLADKGLYTGILMMPLLPGLTDNADNVRAIIHQAKAAGARFIYPAFGLTMRSGQREYLYRQLDRLFPGMREQYQKRYGERYYCPSPQAKKLHAIFVKDCDELGLLHRMSDIVKSYRMGYGDNQLTFF